MYGTGSFSINDTEVTVNTVDEYVDIDSESMQCHKGNVNCGQNVQLTDYPTLVGGDNTVTLDGVTRLVITPRWWKI